MSGRRVHTVVITMEGRDKGKTFVLTEMPAGRAEEWALRALLAITNSGTELPEDVQGAGMAGVAAVGLKGVMNVRFTELKPLLDEMWECIQYMPTPTKPGILRPPMEEDIEEVVTRLFLRNEVFKLHTGFSLADDKLNMTSPMSPAAKEHVTSLPIKTSRGRSARS